MMKYKVLIVDDEPIPRKIMYDYCNQSRFFEKIVEVKDGVEALELLNNHHFDLLLLDINMPLLSGLSLAKCVNANTKVIFVTAYAEHAVEAFELNVIDYLLKPVTFERFMKAIQKFAQTESNIASETNLYVTVKQGKKSLKIQTEEILYCEARGNNTLIFLTDNSILDVYSPLKKLLNDLPGKQFIRVHRAFIVNKKKIKAIENNLLYIGKLSIPIGRTFKDDVSDVLGG